MIELPVSQPRLTRGGPNERFASESGEAGRCHAAGKKHQREFIEELLQISAPPISLRWSSFCASKARYTTSRVRGARQSRGSGLVMRFQSSLNTVAGERIISLSARQVNPAYLVHSPRYAVLTCSGARCSPDSAAPWPQAVLANGTAPSAWRRRPMPFFRSRAAALRSRVSPTR